MLYSNTLTKQETKYCVLQWLWIEFAYLFISSLSVKKKKISYSQCYTTKILNQFQQQQEQAIALRKPIGCIFLKCDQFSWATGDECTAGWWNASWM